MVLETIKTKAIENINKCRKLGYCNQQDPLRKYVSIETLLPRGIIHLTKKRLTTKIAYTRPLTRIYNNCPRGVDIFVISVYARYLAYTHGQLPKELKTMIQEYKKNGSFSKNISKK